VADDVDRSCVHLISGLQHNDSLMQTEWLCLDCGRVFASLTDGGQEPSVHAVQNWADRVGIPYAKVARYLRGIASEPGTVRSAR